MIGEFKIELKVFGLYSLAAKELKCTSAEVDEVYSWYIDEILKTLMKNETKQVYLKGLGMLRANPACIPNIVYRNTMRYHYLAEAMIRFPKYHTHKKVELLMGLYNKYLKVYEDGLIKLETLLEEPIFNKPMYHKQKERLLTFKTTQLDKLYESI